MHPKFLKASQMFEQKMGQDSRHIIYYIYIKPLELCSFYWWNIW